MSDQFLSAFEVLPDCEVSARDRSRLLMRIDDVLRTLGAPGDWGYGTKLGELTRVLHAQKQVLCAAPKEAPEGGVSGMSGSTQEKQFCDYLLGRSSLQVPESAPDVCEHTPKKSRTPVVLPPGQSLASDLDDFFQDVVRRSSEAGSLPDWKEELWSLAELESFGDHEWLVVWSQAALVAARLRRQSASA